MANATTSSKGDLQDQLDQAIETLDNAYAPESTREELAEAIGQALSTLRGEDDQEDEDDEDAEEDDDLD